MTYEEAKEWLLAIAKKYIHGGDNRFDSRRLKAIDVAIEALEKQIPQKLKRSGKYGVCPSCSRLIERYERKHGNIEIPHCKWCGKKLNWSET